VDPSREIGPSAVVEEQDQSCAVHEVQYRQRTLGRKLESTGLRRFLSPALAEGNEVHEAERADVLPTEAGALRDELEADAERDQAARLRY